MRILQCFGIWVFIQAGKKTDFLYFIGVRQVIRHKKGEPESDDETLIRDGIYGRVRHPLYLGSILVLWGEPYLVSARNGLIIVILSTLYFYLGSMLEERRMVRQFGDEYRRYQREVPRLFPFLWNRR
jgi:protein-S-isoprenylcysteine O-methyltransferase Ste14